jgi:hypothetical protein
MRIPLRFDMTDRCWHTAFMRKQVRGLWMSASLKWGADSEEKSDQLDQIAIGGIDRVQFVSFF